MFNSSKAQKTSSKIDTIIGPSSNIEGNINSSGTIRIDGKYTGDIITNQDVILGENGYIKGNITALNISISGKLNGNIFCRGLLELQPPGELYGDIEVKKISIGDGAIFKGSCSMLKEQPSLKERCKENTEILATKATKVTNSI